MDEVRYALVDAWNMQKYHMTANTKSSYPAITTSANSLWGAYVIVDIWGQNTYF